MHSLPLHAPARRALIRTAVQAVSARVRRAFRPVAVAASAVAVASAAGAALPAVASAGNTPKLDAKELAVIHRINLVRRDHGLKALDAGVPLGASADRHSAREQRAGVLSHQLPGEASAVDRVAHAARRSTVGEAVYFGSRGSSSAEIVRAWMHSPPHRALLLSSDFGRIGIGIRTGRRGMYATADLAAR